jgi:tRNA-splicing ligase RtcB
MFVLYDKEKQDKPIKVWLENLSQIEEGCLTQALNLSNLPFIHKWVALMSDVHEGFGMPIGGVIALDGIVIPNAVGVDIGCGMAFVETDMHKDELNEEQYKTLVGQIMRNVPTGFEHHKKRQSCDTLDSYRGGMSTNIPELTGEIESGYYQIGTLGGGNHFIELQQDENMKLCIMVHSGSRNFGYKVAKYFNTIAKQLNKKYASTIPESFDLAFLPEDTAQGKDYVEWMNLALDFAAENRQRILKCVMREISRIAPNTSFFNEINAHHNYAAKEKHFGKDVWVHRKGAINAQEGKIGIIPGSMGSNSYIVRGLGNIDSFNSCSHGAGRVIGRNEAKRRYSVEEVISDIKNNSVILGKRNKSDVAEECRMAYKDIDFVISQQLDLIEPVKKLKTVAVIKG